LLLKIAAYIMIRDMYWYYNSSSMADVNSTPQVCPGPSQPFSSIQTSTGHHGHSAYPTNRHVDGTSEKEGAYRSAAYDLLSHETFAGKHKLYHTLHNQRLNWISRANIKN
jgi:hypothetical protein